MNSSELKISWEYKNNHGRTYLILKKYTYKPADNVFQLHDTKVHCTTLIPKAYTCDKEENNQYENWSHNTQKMTALFHDFKVIAVSNLVYDLEDFYFVVAFEFSEDLPHEKLILWTTNRIVLSIRKRHKGC